MALTRQDIAGQVLWTSVLNGEQVKFVTTDTALIVTERGVVDEHVIGVELVDQSGKRLAWSVRSQ